MWRGPITTASKFRIKSERLSATSGIEELCTIFLGLSFIYKVDTTALLTAQIYSGN